MILDSADFRSTVPRLSPENRKANKVFVELLEQMAARKDATAAQVALVWLLAQKPWIVPIPGTTKLHRLEENIGGASIVLAAEELAEIETAASKMKVAGERYSEGSAKMIDR